MKRNLLAILAVFSFAWAFAQDSTKLTIAPAPPAQAVAIGDTIIGGQTYYIIADLADSIYSNVRFVSAKFRENPPKSPGDWWVLIVTVMGVLTSLSSQLVRFWKAGKSLIDKMPKGEPIVALISFAIGAIWLYLETQFVGFHIRDLFFRAAGVFMVAILAYRWILSKYFKKTETASAPIPVV